MAVHSKNSEIIQQGIKNWLKAECVDLFLFDLDDTITPTREIFSVQMEKGYNLLLPHLAGVSRPDLKSTFEGINNRAFEKFAVNPRRWETVLNELTGFYPSLDQTILQQTLEVLLQIYKTPVQYKDGAEKTLKTFKEAGVPMGVVTHANEEWTWKKFDWLRLGRFVDKRMVHIVDQNNHKTSREWAEAAKKFGTEPIRIAVAGDSARTDINPAYQIGVRPQHLFWVNNPSSWIVHKEEVPAGTVIVSGIHEILSGFALQDDG